MDCRRKLWTNIMDDLGPPEGCIVPRWLLFVYTLLFPLHGLKSLLCHATGFDHLRLTWKIHGIEFSDRFFTRLAAANGELYRFTTVNGIVTIERASTAATEPKPASESFEFSVFDSEHEEQAGGTAPTYSQALSEGQHYLAMYSQDGRHYLELRRVETLSCHAAP